MTTPDEVREALAAIRETLHELTMLAGGYEFRDSSMLEREITADLATIESHIASTQEEAERRVERRESLLQEYERLFGDINTARDTKATLESRIAELEGENAALLQAFGAADNLADLADESDCEYAERRVALDDAEAALRAALSAASIESSATSTITEKIPKRRSSSGGGSAF